MIIHFKDKETEKVFNGIYSRKLPEQIQHLAQRKLHMINRASKFEDLMIPPGNRFEYLKGDLANYCSIRINKQHRICFSMNEEFDFYDVEIVDYH